MKLSSSRSTGTLALFLFLALLRPALACAAQDTLVINAEALRHGRAFVRSIVLSVPGIDLVAYGHPRFQLADDPAFAGRTFDDGDWQPFDSLTDAGLLRGQPIRVRFDLHVDPELAGTSVDLDIYTQGAMEVYFNGERWSTSGRCP